MKVTREDFCIALFKSGCLKFGQFTLKSGINSNYYIDLRLLIAHPNLMSNVTDLISEMIHTNKIEFETICGVPYTALPIASLLSVSENKGMVLRRKEPKTYGTKQLIEGKYQKGDRSIIIEDVITSGNSILETAEDIKTVGMIVEDVIVIVDREEGAMENLLNHGLRVHRLFSLSEITKILFDNNFLDAELIQKIITEQKNILKSNKSNLKDQSAKRTELSFEKRIEYCKSSVATKLFQILIEKQTNLCLAADLSEMDKLLALADELGPYICIFKVHMDIVESYSDKQIDELKNLAVRHNFLIMEDRKLADIGNTVRMQFNNLSKWANLVTSHSISGFGILEGIKKAEFYSSNVGVFLIAELSSKNNLITAEYTKKTIELAENYEDMVIGIVSQTSVCNNPGIIQITPGVNLEENVQNDSLGQQYRSPEKIILEDGADIAVVGRGIINASKRVETAKLYRKKLWDIYLMRVNQ